MDTSIKDDALTSFEQGKSTVIEFARQLRAVAVDRGDEESAKTLEELSLRFEENRFLVVSVGPFKTGKSTLMNALAGRGVCPMRSTPHTARLTRIFATAEGAPEVIKVHFKAERATEELPFSETALTDLVSMKGGRHEEVASVDVFVRPTGLLIHPGIVLVDTPGLESIYAEHDRITKEFLPRADLVLFYMTAKQALGARERDFLLSHPDILKKCIIVVTHADVVPPDEVDEVMAFVRSGLKEQVLGSEREPELFAVSGKLALDGVNRNDPELLARSGVPALAGRIREILSRERGRPIIRAIAMGERDVARALVKQLAAARQVQQTKVTADVRERGVKLLKVIGERSAALEQLVVREIEDESRELASALPGRVGSLRTELKGAVRAWIGAYPNEETCRQRLPADLANYAQRWLDVHEAHLRRSFKKITSRASATSRNGFEALQREAIAVFERDRAIPGLAEIAGGIEALSDLSALASCMGGPIGGYGLASQAIEPAFQVPPAIRALTLGAGLLSVFAAIGGPIGWGAAVVGWIAVGIANMVRSSTWRTRTITQIDAAIDAEMVPRIERALSTEAWKFGRSLQDHMAAHVRSVRRRLSEVVEALMRRVETDSVAEQKQVMVLKDAEDRLLAIVADIERFIASLPGLLEHVAEAAEDPS